MTAAVRQRPQFPDLFDWADQFPPFFAARSLLSPHLIRVEDKIEDGRYVIKAEMPGIDPDKDVKITLNNDRLVIDAERTEDKSDKSHSEFQYGSFHRAMTLPAGAKVDDIKATYNDGILTVTIGIGEETPVQARRIPVARS
jgi:HSP20 family molecular chaperone IbpA